MSVNYIDKSTGDLIRVAGGGNDILYADSPIGSIIPFGGTTAPDGFLLCQGQAVSRTTYAELFAVIGTAYGSGNGSTTFNVPDFRETVPVGSGTRGSGVTDHDTYTVGQFKDDQMQSHKHRMDITTAGTMTVYGLSYAEGTDSVNSTETREVSNARNGTTTHGKQLGVNYIIKAIQVDAPADFAPVDVVENGNMKAVTSNAVRSLFSAYEGYADITPLESGGSLTIPANSVGSWIKTGIDFVNPHDVFIPRFFGNGIVIVNWSVRNGKLIFLPYNLTSAPVTLERIWFNTIKVVAE